MKLLALSSAIMALYLPSISQAAHKLDTLGLSPQVYQWKVVSRMPPLPAGSSNMFPHKGHKTYFKDTTRATKAAHRRQQTGQSLPVKKQSTALSNDGNLLAWHYPDFDKQPNHAFHYSPSGPSRILDSMKFFASNSLAADGYISKDKRSEWSNKFQDMVVQWICTPKPSQRLSEGYLADYDAIPNTLETLTQVLSTKTTPNNSAKRITPDIFARFEQGAGLRQTKVASSSREHCHHIPITAYPAASELASNQPR